MGATYDSGGHFKPIEFSRISISRLSGKQGRKERKLLASLFLAGIDGSIANDLAGTAQVPALDHEGPELVV